MDDRKRQSWRTVAILLTNVGLSCCTATLLLSCILLWGGVREGWFEDMADFLHGWRPPGARVLIVRPWGTVMPSPTPPLLVRERERLLSGGQMRPEEMDNSAREESLPTSPSPEREGQPALQTVVQEPLPSLGARLIIPALSLDVPIVEIPLQNGTWDVTRLSGEVAHLEGTARPGENNNVVMAGHITLASGGYGPFKELDKLRPGDPVVVHADDRNYVYLVDYSQVVSAEAVEVVQPTNRPILTLITCVNWDLLQHRYRDRFIVVARLSENSAFSFDRTRR